MGKIARHSPGSVLFSETVRTEHVGEARIVRGSIRIVGPLFSIGCGIRLLAVERIFNRRFQWLVMRRQRTILQSAGNIEPAHTIRMQSERPRAAKRLRAVTFMNVRGMIGRHFFVVIGIVEARPMLFLVVPPNQLLALTPRFAIGPRGSAVVNDSTIIRPSKAPAMAKQILGISFFGAIVVFLRKYSAVNPGSACGRAIILQIFDVLKLLARGQRKTVDFSQHFFDIGLRMLAFGGVLPGQRS